ncbi:hypothetical protein NVP2096O_37 [Vibrio phage 2.096.O._10N.286.48.B5]|nr:hypothetical protein NVP2096O_37 [Vibrio phage 2.096.O._10N.286.48.B5]
MKFYYGIKSKSQARDIAVKVACAFGGGYKAMMLMIETACTETHLGTYPDRHPEKLGVGITQFDEIGLDDLKARTRSRHYNILLNEFGYDLNLVELSDLAHDATLAFALTRMKYILVPEPIPRTLAERADYWKRHWNSNHPNAKGTPASYISDVIRHNT